MSNSFLEHSDPQEAFLDENLAKFGDALVNLIYSLARSIARERPDGAKVSNKVLSESLSDAGLREIAPSRCDRHDLGDIAESIIAYAWINDLIEIEEAAEILSKSLKKTDFRSRKEIFKMSEKGFKNLLLTISKRIPIEKSQI